MTVTTLQPSVPAAQRPGSQSTAIEQSRAIAEVQAAIVVAQQCPRDVPGALRAMRDSCQQPALAERAFFRFPRGKDDNGRTNYVNGASVHLARDLARVWGNVQYGIAELSRDDPAGHSEMIAFAWDVQTNTRASTAFITPHRRDTRNGVVDLTDMRDIYENNANNGARRVREMIFAVLPAWFTEEAKAICQSTIENGGGKPLAQRVVEAVDGFAGLGVPESQLARKLGTESAAWTAQDVAQLGVIFTSLRNGEIRRDDEFPADTASLMTAADITGGQKGAQQATAIKPVNSGRRPPASPPQDRAPARAATGQVSIIEGHWGRLGFEKHELAEVLNYTAKLAGAESLSALAELTQDQAKAVQDTLSRFKVRDQVIKHLYPQGQPEVPGESQ
jgi:hypothetical protein